MLEENERGVLVAKEYELKENHVSAKVHLLQQKKKAWEVAPH